MHQLGPWISSSHSPIDLLKILDLSENVLLDKQSYIIGQAHFLSTKVSCISTAAGFCYTLSILIDMLIDRILYESAVVQAWNIVPQLKKNRDPFRHLPTPAIVEALADQRSCIWTKIEYYIILYKPWDSNHH